MKSAMHWRLDAAKYEEPPFNFHRLQPRPRGRLSGCSWFRCTGKSLPTYLAIAPPSRRFDSVNPRPFV